MDPAFDLREVLGLQLTGCDEPAKKVQVEQQLSVPRAVGNHEIAHEKGAEVRVELATGCIHRTA